MRAEQTEVHARVVDPDRRRGCAAGARRRVGNGGNGEYVRGRRVGRTDRPRGGMWRSANRQKGVLQNAFPPNTCTHRSLILSTWMASVHFQTNRESRARVPTGCKFDRVFFRMEASKAFRRTEKSTAVNPVRGTGRAVELRSWTKTPRFARTSFFYHRWAPITLLRVASDLRIAAFTPPPPRARARRAAGLRCPARASASTPSPPGPRRSCSR